MRGLLLFLLLFSLSQQTQAGTETVGDWQFDVDSAKGSYTAITYSATKDYGDSALSIIATPQQKGPCKVRLGYNLFGAYASTLKGKTAKVRVDQEKVHQISFDTEHSGRNRDGTKFTTAYIDIETRSGKALIGDMADGKWLRLRLEGRKVDRFSLAGVSRAARAVVYFCKTPNIKDRYPMEMLKKRMDDDSYL